MEENADSRAPTVGDPEPVHIGKGSVVRSRA